MTATVDNAVADLQRANAELQRQLDERTAERDEALQRETATAEVLGVINSSPGDLSPVFDAMLEKALRLCDAAFGLLIIWDGEQFHRVAFRGVPGELMEAMRQPLKPVPGAFADRLVRGERVIAVTDLLEAADQPLGPGAQLLVRFGARSYVGVALCKDEALLGGIVIYRREVRPFTDKQITLLQNFAAQAVIAMENARLITETREALEQQTATAEVLQVINASPGDLTPVFDAILEKAHRLCGVEYGVLQLYEGEKFRAVAARGYPEKLEQLVRRPYSLEPNSPVHALLHGKALVEIPDVIAHQAEAPNPRAEAAIAVGMRGVLFLPLRRDNQLLGMITAARKEARRFAGKEIAVLQNFATQAVIAMENARLITETREALEQQTATAEVLGVINSSPGDLAPVFDAMLEKAMTLCDAAFGALRTWDGEHLTRVAWRAPPGQGDVSPEAVTAAPGSIAERFVRGETVVSISDLIEDNTFHQSVGAQALVRRGSARSFLGVALRKDDQLLGTIVIYRQEVRPFSDKQIALLQNFAAQAVIAMENARLLGELRARTEEIAGWNRELEARVAAQLAEIERTGKLRRFLAPQLADLILAQGDESILESHRREIVVVFCDLRGFTGFAERAEPEEVMALLRDYHAAMGPIVAQFEGTIDHYGGDGIMVFFNDPLPTPDPARRAIDMAVAMRVAAQDLLRSWRRHGHDIGFGVGISQGYATLGQIGFAERMDYTAIGTVTNLAARLCAEAKDGQILVSRRVAIAVEDSAQLEEIGDLSLKGLSQAVAVYNVPQ